MVQTRMATAQIENSLIFHEQMGLLILAFHPRVEYLSTLSAGVIAVAGDGRIHSINQRGQVLLTCTDARPGKHFEDLFSAHFPATMDSLLEGGIIQVRDHAGGGLFIVCRQIGGRSGQAPPPMVKTVPRKIHATFVCEDPHVAEQMRNVAEATKTGMPIHITGETGTGKEIMARHAHECSGRKGPFVAVNCGAIPGTLFVAELFGHEKGAYTNARAEGSPGLIRMADKGTLFLDEVGEIPLSEQAVLLRFLDTMEVRPVGGRKDERVDVQILSASNRQLEKEVEEGRFRADLFYRLRAMAVVLPPLRQRQDFLEIVRFLMERIAPGQAITDEAIERLRQQPWPGNFRELRATLQRIVMRTEGGCLDEQAIMPFCGAGGDVCPDCLGHPLSSRKCEEIRNTYRVVGRNISEAARLLGISRTTIYKHLRGITA